MNYLQEVQKGMDLLAESPYTIFMGQAVGCKGHAISRQVENYLMEKRLELPVAEEMQTGMALGMALEGYIPVSVYPRCNFAILACSQIVNHIDKWPLMVPNSTRPKVIMKMVVGSVHPLDPGHQHKANYADAFKSMCETIEVFDLTQKEDIMPAYDKALNRNDGRSTILVEYGDKYNG